MGDIVHRGGRWYVRYLDVDGRRRMRATHQPSRELARRFLLAIEARIARGQVGIPEPAPLAPTVAQLVERFLQEYRQPKIKNLDRYRVGASSTLRRVLPTLGGLRADVVTSADLDRLRDDLASACSAGSAGQTFTYLKTAFAWAARLGIIAQNPLQRAQAPRASDAEVDFLTADEVAALLTAADRQAAAGQVEERLLRCAVYLAVHAGLRKGELLGLRWRDVDVKTRRLSICRSFATTPKGGKPRQLRVPAEVVPVLTAWALECPRTPEGLVFPRLHDGVWGMFANTSAMLGLPALLASAGCRPIARAWHTMRHTFASHYVMSGGNLLALQKILGHGNIRFTMIYAHLAPDFLGDEMDRVKFRSKDKALTSE